MHFRYKRRKSVVSMVEQTEVDIEEDPEVDMGMSVTANMAEEGVDSSHVLILVRLVTSHDFSAKFTCSVPIVIVLNM
jgi:hypothetical protein